MKNPLKYLKHIVKDPITTIAEADARKKEIMPLLYGSAGVLAVSVILQIVAKLDFMSIFSFIGLVGAGFCGFLLMVINKAKTKFQALTCDKCNTLAEIKTPEDFAKYVSYTVEKDEAKFHGYTGNRKPTDGVYSQVKFSGSASAVLSVALTCPHCGEIKRLRFSADPFKCHAEATRVGALQLAGVRASLEAAVKAAVSDYNDPDKKGSIPYTFHSSKNPNFENRYSFKGANGVDARPNYMGAIIDYHKDVEEILEHYFVFNELTGTLIDPDASSKKNTKSNKTEMASSQNVPNHATTLEVDKYPVDEPEITEERTADIPVAPTCEAVPEETSVVAQEGKEEQKSERKNCNKSVAIITICAALIIGGVVVGLTVAHQGQGKNDGETNTPTESTPQQSETETTTDMVEKIQVNDYVGYWYIKENQEKELTIHSGSSNSVNFSLWYSKEAKINNVSAELQADVAPFSLAVDGAVIKGKLTFHKDAITVHIIQSTLTSMPVEELEFTELHMSSLMPNEEEQEETGDTDEDASSAPSNDSEQDSKPSMNAVPYLFPTADNSYGIYEAPSYDSDYVKILPKGTYTIVAEEYDGNNNLWGKLKSGVGWICVAENTGE